MSDEKNKRKGVGGCVVVGVRIMKKFCSSDWSAEREPSSIMYIMDP